MKKKIIYLILIVTLINLIALGTVIYQRWLNPDKSPCTSLQESRFEQIKSALALSPLQVARFEEIRHDFHSKIDSLDQILEAQNRILLQEIWRPQSDETRIDTLLNRISQLQMKSQHLVIWHFYQFKAVLTPAQWQKFYGIVAERFPSRLRNSSSQRTEKDNK
ncbi:periplasmic heavy metal sensor [candidate division KSB1 bacterium]|nr:periplasmic heavy metal sensor [candidate division KSB1 bacterium]